MTHLQKHRALTRHFESRFRVCDYRPCDGRVDDLLDGSPLRYAGNEEPDKGGPRNPPTPVEDGPPAHVLRVQCQWLLVC